MQPDLFINNKYAVDIHLFSHVEPK